MNLVFLVRVKIYGFGFEPGLLGCGFVQSSGLCKDFRFNVYV